MVQMVIINCIVIYIYLKYCYEMVGYLINNIILLFKTTIVLLVSFNT